MININVSNPKYQLSIDTLYLIKKLTNEEKQFIHDRLEFCRASKYYRHTLHFADIGVRFNLSPKKEELHTNFNAQIQLHKEFFTSDIPDSIMEIITQIDWSVTRLDLSYDFKTDMKDSILFKHDKRLKDSGKHYSNETYYIGSYHVEDGQKQKKSIIHYDRNVKNRKRNSPITHLYGNRLEPRLKFAMKDMKLASMNHELIMKELMRYRFISDIDSMKDTNGWQKNRIRKMQQDYNQFLSYSAKEQRAIRKTFKANREPIDEYYAEHVEHLFSPFKATQDELQAITTVLHPTAGLFMQRHSTAGIRYLYTREGGTTYAEVS